MAEEWRSFDVCDCVFAGEGERRVRGRAEDQEELWCAGGALSPAAGHHSHTTAEEPATETESSTPVDTTQKPAPQVQLYTQHLYTRYCDASWDWIGLDIHSDVPIHKLSIAINDYRFNTVFLIDQ